MSDTTKALVATYTKKLPTLPVLNSEGLVLAKTIDDVSSSTESNSTSITEIEEQVSALGLKSVVATYDFSVDGGEIGIIDTDIVIPNNSIIPYIYLKVVSSPLSDSNTGTIICQLKDQVDIISEITADGTANGIIVGTPNWAAVNMIETTANRTVSFEISTEALTAGILKVFIFYNTY